MIKWLLIISLSALIVAVAYGILNYYKKRENFFANLMDFCSRLSNEISFLKTNLPSIVSNAESYKSEFQIVLTEFKSMLERGDINENNFKQILKRVQILKEEEQDSITAFFTSLGKTSLQEQLNCIAHYKVRFSELFNTSRQENSKFGGVSLKLGIILAIAVCIVFI